jgi:hypothetical protein
MGMIFEGRRLTPEQSAAVEADPSAADALLDRDEDVLDLDKAWHAIHFLLTGSEWDTPAGAGEAILGGDPVGSDTGYGPPRLLAAERVRAVAADLQDLTPDSLRARFDPAALLAAAIYPQVWDDDDFETYLAPNFVSLRAFYLTAAERNQAVLLVIT